MKKIVSLVLAMLIMTVGVFAEAPAFMTEVITNYTADYSVSVTFDTSDDIAALLDELEMPEEISNVVDVKMLLKTLLFYEGKMTAQADISDNYKKIKIGVTVDSAHKVDVNPNLNIGVNAKTGIWMDLDFSSEQNAKAELIYSLPVFNKYLKLDMTEQMDIESLKSIYSKEYIETVGKESVEMLIKYADVTKNSNKYTVKIDNDGLTAYLDELFPYVMEKTSELYVEEDSGIYTDFNVIPSMKGWKILGEKGIVCTYTLLNGKVNKSDVNADISLDISEIYATVTGEEWPYSSKGLLDFTVDISCDISKKGNTKVNFPVLTDENTMTVEDFEPEYEYADTEEPEYPLWYINVGCEQMYEAENDGMYIPLRATLEAAYEDTVTLEYNNGVITAVSDYFPFEKLTVTIGSNKVYTDDKEYVTAEVCEVDGTTYVDYTLFCDIFGWELGWAQYDILNKYYEYTFYRE